MVRGSGSVTVRECDDRMGLTLLGQSCLCVRSSPGREGTDRAQSGFVCPGCHPLIFHFSCTEVPHSWGWLLCSLMESLTTVCCWVLLVPAGDDLFLPAPLPLWELLQLSLHQGLENSRGFFTLVGDQCFKLPLAEFNECAQNGEVWLTRYCKGMLICTDEP